jgi:hypothetical protein
MTVNAVFGFNRTVHPRDSLDYVALFPLIIGAVFVQLLG